jgi:8-oxo-dGTP pyrophosphatase MutT (NUDIX family)
MTIRKKVQVWIYTYNSTLQTYSFLILFTNPTRGKFWQPVTGSVENAESLVDAALREAQEETGLSFSKQPQPLGDPFEFKSQWAGDVKEYGFSLEVDSIQNQTGSHVRVDPNEHTDFQWVSAAEALKMIAYPSNQQMLISLLERLGISAKES